ncbi:MAG TPA: aromatic ring-hydroxylating dioxygenase subunit alpha [Thermoplasmata archaeon]|nr:aromatic ring-hydroxylating dioxygenase subunit alpha [Thermoplasmata archaeon]
MRVPMEESLPRAYYVSPDLFEAERERIFYREWFCAGREETLPAAGDTLVLDVAGESVLVVRTRASDLRAFYNVCRHRGSRLVEPPSGDAAFGPTVRLSGSIRCPYHAWTYGLDGELLSASHLGALDAADKAAFSLYPVGLETWGGFVFVNLSPEDATSRGLTLAAQLGPIPGRVARYPLAALRTARQIAYDVRANWKVLAENYNECYHCGPVHPELCEVVPAFKRDGGANLAWEDGIPHRDGAWTFTRTGTTNRRPFPDLSEEERVRHKGELLYPNAFLSLSPDHVASFLLWPQGPARTRVVCDFLFHPDEMARPDFDPSDAVDFWDLINRQDWAVCERVQAGMQSRAFRHGYYGPMEDLSLDIRRYIRDRLGEIRVE